MLIVGVDPGLKGGIAWYCTISKDTGAIPMPDTPRQICTRLQNLREIYGTMHVVLEYAQPMPKQGVTSVFSYGQHFGELIGILTALNASMTLVRPAVWKKALGLNSEKLNSILLAERLYPEVSLTPGQCRKPQDGIAEALLLMHYGRQTL